MLIIILDIIQIQGVRKKINTDREPLVSVLQGIFVSKILLLHTCKVYSIYSIFSLSFQHTQFVEFSHKSF